MNNSNLRIVKDIIDFNKNKPDDIYINFDKNNITIIHSLIVGPSGTPYYGGLFLFEIKFPTNYPYASPSVKFLTTDGIVRFNPNLYANGKVCLSILGTWSGPKWEPVMTLSSVLLSIQSLLSSVPLKNEPGYDNIKSDDIKSLQYSQYIQYNTYEIGILSVLNKKIYPELFKKFENEIIIIMEKNYNNLTNDILSFAEIYGIVPLLNLPYIVSNKKDLDFKQLCYNFIEYTVSIKKPV